MSKTPPQGECLAEPVEAVKESVGAAKAIQFHGAEEEEGSPVPQNKSLSKVRGDKDARYLRSHEDKKRTRTDASLPIRGAKGMSNKQQMKRSSSIADFKRGITPLQLAKKEEEKKRKKRAKAESLMHREDSAISETDVLAPAPPQQKEVRHISSKALHKFTTALSCNSSLLSLQAEKAADARNEEVKSSRRIAGALMQYSHVIRKEDESSLFAKALSQSAEFIDITGELQASWCRNLERRVTVPMRELYAAASSEGDESEKLTGNDLAHSINSLIGFAGVYSNFFRVGHDNLGNCYDALMEYRSVVAMDTDGITLEVGKRCALPFEDISIHGVLIKKGSMNSWKSRWFVLYFHNLLYFASESESILQGHISLENATITATTSKKYPHVLQVTCAQRTTVFALPSAELLAQWKILLEASVIKQPSSGKRSQIALVEPKVFVSSGKAYKPPGRLVELLRQDLFSRHWRDFRAKEPGMMSWITQPTHLSDLVTNALMFVPDVTKEEISVLEEAVKNAAAEEEKASQTGKIKRTLSTLVRSGKQESSQPLSTEQLKRSNNALLYKYAHNAYTLLTSSEQMAESFVKCEPAMIQLFDFMKDEKPPVQPRRFHAFTELIFQLLHHRSTQVFEFLCGHKEIFVSLFIHLENEHCLRLMLSFWSYTQCEEKVNVLNEIGILALKRFFEPPAPLTLQMRTNLTVLIRELIRRHRLLNMRPETVMILNKMRETDKISFLTVPMTNINLEEGLECFTPRTRRQTLDERAILASLPVGLLDNESDTSVEEEKLAKPRREVEQRRDWEDIGWEGEDDEASEFSSAETDEPSQADQEGRFPSPTSSSAPKKPLPELPMSPRERTNQEELNARAPGYLESKVAPFMNEMKNRNRLRTLVSGTLASHDTERWESSLEILIAMLKISRSKESATGVTEDDVADKKEKVVQKVPHNVIREITGKFSVMAELLHVPPADRDPSIPLPPLGLFRYNLVRLVRYVVDCGFKFVDTNLQESELLTKTFDLMFAYPRHSILLATMSEMIDIIFTRNIHSDLCLFLLEDYKLHVRLMQVIDENPERSLPIVSHVINFANTLSANQAVQRILSEDEQWVEFLADDIFPSILAQYVNEVDIPAPDPARRQGGTEKWKKRWEDFNFLFSV